MVSDKEQALSPGGRTDFDAPQGPRALQFQRGRIQSPVHCESVRPEALEMEVCTCQVKDHGVGFSQLSWLRRHPKSDGG